MSQYQIYMLNDLGEIVDCSEAECASDEEARFRAQALLKADRLADVWIGTRQVGFVHPHRLETLH